MGKSVEAVDVDVDGLPVVLALILVVVGWPAGEAKALTPTKVVPDRRVPTAKNWVR